jgi:hypothetical protein
MTHVALAGLFLGLASLLVLGGAIFALLLFFPLFLVGLGGVLVGGSDHTVRQHDPRMDGTGWRDGA